MTETFWHCSSLLLRLGTSERGPHRNASMRGSSSDKLFLHAPRVHFVPADPWHTAFSIGGREIKKNLYSSVSFFRLRFGFADTPHTCGNESFELEYVCQAKLVLDARRLCW